MTDKDCATNSLFLIFFVSFLIFFFFLPDPEPDCGNQSRYAQVHVGRTHRTIRGNTGLLRTLQQTWRFLCSLRSSWLHVCRTLVNSTFGPDFTESFNYSPGCCSDPCPLSLESAPKYILGSHNSKPNNLDKKKKENSVLTASRNRPDGDSVGPREIAHSQLSPRVGFMIIRVTLMQTRTY